MDRIFVTGWLMSLNVLISTVAFSFLWAIPFAWAWNTLIPAHFAQYLPVCIHTIPYFHFVALMLVINFLGQVISKLTPRLFITKDGE